MYIYILLIVCVCCYSWRFSVEAEDHSGKIEIVLMDREARTVLGVYAPEDNGQVK